MAGAPYLVYFGFRVAVLFSIGNPGIHYSGYWSIGVVEYWIYLTRLITLFPSVTMGMVMLA